MQSAVLSPNEYQITDYQTPLLLNEATPKVVLPNQLELPLSADLLAVTESTPNPNAIVNLSATDHLVSLKNDGVNNKIEITSANAGSYVVGNTIQYTYDDYNFGNGTDSDGTTIQTFTVTNLQPYLELSKTGKYTFYSDYYSFNGEYYNGPTQTLYVMSSFDTATTAVGSGIVVANSFGLSSPLELVMLSDMSNATATKTLALNLKLNNNLNFADSNSDGTLNDPFDYNGSDPGNMKSIEGTYTGYFSGQGFEIINLDSVTGGIFTTLNNATIQDLYVTAPQVNSNNIEDIGLIANTVSGDVNIINSAVSDLKLINNAANISHVGGLVGVAAINSQLLISNSYTSGEISMSGQNINVGAGLIGLNQGDAIITNSYSTVNITTTNNNLNYSMIGGLIGDSNNANVVIDNAYYRGELIATNPNQVNPTYNGGLIGRIGGAATYDITNSFAYLNEQINQDGNNAKLAGLIGGVNLTDTPIVTFDTNTIFYSYGTVTAANDITNLIVP